MTAPEDLAPLLAAIGGGDRAAFRRLYEASAPKLLGVALRMTRDRALAEEILQDVYLRIWQSAARYSDEAGRPMTWMIAITRYRAIDILRQRRERLLAPGPEGEDAFESIPAPGSGEDEIVLADSLRRCLGTLDERQRRCVVLAYREGFSREELAERFGANVNTVKTWLRRSLDSLRRCLEPA